MEILEGFEEKPPSEVKENRKKPIGVSISSLVYWSVKRIGEKKSLFTNFNLLSDWKKLRQGLHPVPVIFPHKE